MSLSSIGFTTFDCALIVACTVGAVFGSIVQIALAVIKHDGPPRSLKDLSIAPPEIQEVRGIWMYLRLVVGGVLGFVFALYFVGMLNPSAGTFARILALSFVVGYAAPKIWALKNDQLMIQMRADREKA